MMHVKARTFGLDWHGRRTAGAFSLLLAFASACEGASSSQDAGGGRADTTDSTDGAPLTPIASTAQLLCGMEQTCAAGQVCCVLPGPEDRPLTGSCMVPADCVGVSLHCTRQLDCEADEICCGAVTIEGTAQAVCQTSCAGRQLCETSDECPADTQCLRVIGGSGVRTCGVVSVSAQAPMTPNEAQAARPESDGGDR